MNVRPLAVPGSIQEIPETLPESPLPGGIAAVLRFFFHVPQWIQILGAILGVLLGIVLLALLWRRRGAIRGWVASRPVGFRVGLAAVGAIVLLTVAGFGAVSWDYMQHDNDFCTGCHVMASSFQRFTESEHAELSCHDCHRQSIFASTRQLYLWVTDRPEEIGEHAPVPTEICAECHIRRDPQETWQRISATAGHRVHLESDSAALAEVMCVTCHGQEVHEFVPADATCGQSGCHEPAATDIALGEMSGQTGLHCVTCHEFTAPVPEGEEPGARPAGLLTPGESQCLSCHQMEALLPAFDARREPHDAKCGACHNPHVQEGPEAALQTCTDAGCHARPDTLTSFHRGIPEAVVTDCLGCHALHEWTVDGQDCAACHAEIAGARTAAASGAGSTPPVVRGPAAPAAGRTRAEAVGGRAAALPVGHPPLRRATEPARWGMDPGIGDAAAAPGAAGGPRPGAASAAHVVPAAHGLPAAHGVPAVDAAAEPTRRGASGRVVGPPAQERFDHRQHGDLECTACHSTTGQTHGEVTVSGAADCFSCHHSQQSARVGCGGCHGPSELAGREAVPVRLRLSVWDSERARRLPFDHAAHRRLDCGTCHAGAPRMAVSMACADCHDDHHQADNSCMTCHPTPPADAHTARVHTEGCTGSGCHVQPTFASMQRTRDFCLSCHQERPGPDHEPGQLCVDCHLVPADEASAPREGSPGVHAVAVPRGGGDG